MGEVIDFEVKQPDPPVECSDGYGLPKVDWNAHEKAISQTSNPFPWVKAIDTPTGGFVRFQIDHENYVDIDLSAERAMALCCDLALIAARILGDQR
jgi:hypothetical protein